MPACVDPGLRRDGGRGDASRGIIRSVMPAQAGTHDKSAKIVIPSGRDWFNNKCAAPLVSQIVVVDRRLRGHDVID